MKTLIVTEKTSVASDIARVLGVPKGSGCFENNKYILIGTNGHLVTTVQPEEYNAAFEKWDVNSLPIFPDQFKYKVSGDDLRVAKFELMKKLMNRADVETIVCATDAGREGQLIFELVYMMAHCTKPVLRFWTSSLTDSEILKAFSNLQDNKKYYGLYQSSLARQQADWITGINYTRLISCVNNSKCSVGRVQSPTLAMVVERNKQATDFRSAKFYQLEGLFSGIPFVCKAEPGNRFDTKQEATDVYNKVNGKPAKITNIETKNKQENPLKLYNLSNLQTEANKIYGYTAQQVLDIAQSLYEKHKLSTYPRTSSNYLSSAQQTELPKLIDSCFNFVPTVMSSLISKISSTPNFKNTIDDTKLSDHHAIIPTSNILTFDKSKLSEPEYNVLKLIVCRFLTALSPVYQFAETNIEISVEDELFTRTIKNPIKKGWKIIRQTMLEKKCIDTPIDISSFIIGKTITADKYNVIEKETTPPDQYTDGTLITAMENVARTISDKEQKVYMKNGLGTEATRAGIIEKLIATHYIERKKKNLIPTQKGIDLISVLPESIKSPIETALWEEQLEGIVNGEKEKETFLYDIKVSAAKIINDVLKEPEKYQISRSDSGRESVGKCPRCGRNIYFSPKGFWCSGYKQCGFFLSTEPPLFKKSKKKISIPMAKKLFKEGKVYVKDFISSKDPSKKYNAWILLDDTGDKYVNLKLDFSPAPDSQKSKIY